MGGPLVFHRLLFLFLNGFLAYKIGKRLIYTFEAVPDNVESYEFDWRKVNLKEPPRLQTAAAERQRLNELLAVKTYDCKKKLTLGDGFEKYVLCAEFGPFKTAASISGDKSATGDLEQQISAQNWILFTPEGSSVLEKLSGDVEVNFFTELDEWHHWHTWDLEQVLKGRRLDVAKFDLYTSHFDSQDQPDVIRKLVATMTTAKQLLLTIRPGDTEKVVWKWYNLLYWLFFEHNYAIVGAIPNGVCGANPRRCQYRVSLAKVHEDDIRSAPVFGLGSPLEEKRRVMKFVEEGLSSCTDQLCLEKIEDRHTVVLVQNHDPSIPPKDTVLESLGSFKKIYLVSPSSPSFKMTTKVIHMPFVVSTLNVEDGQYGKLTSLENIVNMVTDKIDLLILDVDGAEWELLPQLITISKKLEQIAIRGRIFPEENENYRKFYWQLHRLYKLGFEIMSGQVNDPQYSLVLAKINKV